MYRCSLHLIYAVYFKYDCSWKQLVHTFTGPGSHTGVSWGGGGREQTGRVRRGLWVLQGELDGPSIWR